MKKIMILVLILLAACTTIECDEKINCENGKVFPAVHIVDGECVAVKYDEDPCKVEEAEKAIPEPETIAENESTEIETTENDTEPIVAGGKCSTVSPEYRAQCCKREKSCPVTKITIFDEATGECGCVDVEVKRECAGRQCGTGEFSIFDENIGKCVCVKSGTGEITGVLEQETRTVHNLTMEKARQLVIEAFDQKWRKIPGCGIYEDGLVQPDVIEIKQRPGGEYSAHIEYYCGDYFNKPAEPDHKKDLIVTSEGEVTGLYE